MIVRKSLEVLPNSSTAEKEWKIFQPASFSDVNEDQLSDTGKSKGLLKLVLGVVYFISLVSALTVLLT
jgi:hypothetical protein